MALIIKKYLIGSAHRTLVMADIGAFDKVTRCYYQSVTGDLHAKLVKRWKFVAELLDLPEEKSRRIVLNVKGVQSMSEPLLERMAVVLKELKVGPEKLIDHPEILGLVPSRIEQRYYCLKELGIKIIGIPEILRYPTLIKRNAYDLKVMRLLPVDVDPLDHLLSQLTFLNLGFLTKYPSIRNKSLLYIRKVVLYEVFSQRLECQKHEVLRLLETNPVLSNRSICFLLSTINLLLDTLKFNINKLKSSGYMLTVRPSNIEQILSSFPELGSQAMQSFIHKHPRTLLVPAQQILKTNSYLKELGMSDAQITNCGNLYSLPTAVIQNTLSNMHTTQPSDHVRAMDVLRNLNRNFKVRNHTGEDVYSTKDCTLHLAELLGRDVTWIKKELTKHPRLYLNQVRNSRSILDFLFREGFSKLQIENALHLVLYGINTVKATLDALPMHKDIELFGDWKTHPYILQLILYEMERNFFSPEKCDKDIQNVKSSVESDHNISQVEPSDNL